MRNEGRNCENRVFTVPFYCIDFFENQKGFIRLDESLPTFRTSNFAFRIYTIGNSTNDPSI